MTGTGDYEGLLAETVSIVGHGGDRVHAYFARPLGPGPFPGVVLAHHMPGWDAWYKEATRTFAANGYLAICPDLYCRVDHGAPEDVAAKVRAGGGVPDDQVVGDLAAGRDALRALPTCTGKVGVLGSCSGGRHAYLAACCAPGFDACVDLWGGAVVMADADLTHSRPVSPHTYTAQLDCPLLGLFGLEDKAPTPDQVDIHEAELQRLGKGYEFHRYPDAGHGFFYHDRPALYRADAASDGWAKVWAFLAAQLA